MNDKETEFGTSVQLETELEREIRACVTVAYLTHSCGGKQVAVCALRSGGTGGLREGDQVFPFCSDLSARARCAPAVKFVKLSK